MAAYRVSNFKFQRINLCSIFLLVFFCTGSHGQSKERIRVLKEQGLRGSWQDQQRRLNHQPLEVNQMVSKSTLDAFLTFF